MTDSVPTPRQVADRYVDRLCELDPTLATVLGRTPAPDGLPDLSPAGLEAVAGLQRSTLAELDRVLFGAAEPDLVEQRCARLLQERLTAALDLHESG